MTKLKVFNFLSLDGYYEGAIKGDISWHKHGEEEHSYSREQLKVDNILLFGRITYELMASYWPTSAGQKDDAFVADAINKADKIVFSRTLQKADWNNTTVMSGDIVDGIRSVKQSAGKDLTILGSGNIVSQFAAHNLIGEYQIMIDPVVLGAGSSMFSGLDRPLSLKLTDTRRFKSGVMILCYEPATN